VTDPVIWEVGAKGSGLFVVVQRGMLFDISVPSCLRWFLSPHDRRVLKAAALHDYLLGLGWDRVTAAAIFHDALAAAGVGWHRRLLFWLTVSLWKWR
jgi:hypothetical protein